MIIVVINIVPSSMLTWSAVTTWDFSYNFAYIAIFIRVFLATFAHLILVEYCILKYLIEFLWKRIPENVKADHPELQKIWAVGTALWERNLPGAYAALNQTWSEGVSTIMKAVKGM